MPELSTAIWHYSPSKRKVLYAHACRDCGKIRFFNMKRIAALRCKDCRVVFLKTNPKREPYTCRFCGIKFRAIWRKAREPQFCSLKCHNDAQAASNLSRQAYRICKHCHKSFALDPSDARRRPAESCSNTCRLAHHIWINCAHCSKRFNARHNTTRRYCSKRCYLSSWTESRIEKRVRIALEDYQVNFETQFPVKGAHHFDFYVPSLNLLIEADGTYWHSRPWSKERDARKTAKAEALGYTVLRFPELLIMSDQWTTTFSEAIANHLQTHESSGTSPLRCTTVKAPAQVPIHL